MTRTEFRSLPLLLQPHQAAAVLGTSFDCLKGAAKLGLEHYGKDFKWNEGKGWR